MANDITIPATGSGTATPVVATEDISSSHYQKVKIAAGKAASVAMVGHLEDDAHSSGDAGIMALAVRKDTPAALAGADGDYAPLEVDAVGRVHAKDAADQVDDAAFTPGTSVVQMVGAEFDDTAPDSVDEGDGGALRMSSRRELYSQLRDAAGNERGANVSAQGALLVEGGTAHDAADAGSPVKVGAKATTAVSGETSVAANDRTDLRAGVDGVLLARPYTCNEDIVSGNNSNTDGSSTQVLAAGAAGIKHYLTTIILTNTSASNGYVEIKDGTTVKLTVPVPANGGVVVNLPVPLPGTAATAWNFDPGSAMTTIYCSVVGFKSKV